ncbi:MAG TPA: PIN domain-containing protein [Rhizomicrobium sp.]|nr:PIN domain-containing protein [Rhizomicrobium sp.]
MPGTDPLYYWDACLFLAWLKDEARPTGEMDGVREVVERSRKRECRIITSVLTSVEVLSAKMPAGVEHLFTGLMRRVHRQGIDTKIAQLAHDLRNHYAKAGGKGLSTPDALHLATAVLYRADEFHTFDAEGRAKTLGLIPLSGNVAGHRLTICKPEARSPSLDLRKPPDDKK